MRKIYAALAWLLLSILVTMPVPASTPFADTPATSLLPMSSAVAQVQTEGRPPASMAAGYSLSNSGARVFLPLVTRDYRHRPDCSAGSPFSLQIAALHQVKPGLGQPVALQSLTEAQWLALYEEAFPALVDALAASGACSTRVRIDWAWIQPDAPPADYVWGPYHDEKLRMVAETGVRLVAHVDDIPDWAGPAVCGPIHADRLDEFAQFLTDLVNRYKQPPYNIHHWELFNEPDGTWSGWPGMGCWGLIGDQYAQMLAVAYPAIKAADPDATVLMGGVAYDGFTEYDGPFNRYFPDDVMASGGADYLDVTNFHYFPDYHAEWERWNANNQPTCGIVDDGQGATYEAGGIDIIAKASHFRNRLSTCYGVDKPVWLTELGEHGYAGDPESLAQQSRYVIQGHTRALAAGVQNITWFALVSPPYDIQGQGLLYQGDWSPKPAYYTYQTLTNELKGHTYANTLAVPGVEGYVFRGSEGHEKTVAWSRDPQAPAPLTFPSATSLRVVDREGNVSFVHDGGLGDADGIQNGSVTLQMTADPLFVSR